MLHGLNISRKTPVQIDHSIFASYRTHAPICFASWGFLCIRDAGNRGKKITKYRQVDTCTCEASFSMTTKTIMDS